MVVHNIIYQDKTLAIIFLMLTSFLANIDMSPVSSASVSSHEKHKENYWWHYRSCSSRRIRHAREISVNNVRKQINFTYHSIKKLYNEHKDAVPINTTSFSRLRTNTTARFKTMHSHLQHYIVFIHNINATGITSEMDCDSNMSTLKSIERKLRTLMCEIETAINDRRKKKKPEMKKSFIKPKNGYKFDKLDCTSVSMYKSIVLSRLLKLLSDMMKQTEFIKNKSSSSSSSAQSM